MINYTNAAELLEQGRTKDAYAAFLSIVELSTQQLHGVKFVHQTIVSKPIDYENSIQLLKQSIDQLEKIAILPGANSPVLKKSPPPLPPKPTRITKPTIPPKPPLAINTRVNRSRGNSVSFAKELDIIEVNAYEQVDTLLLNNKQVEVFDDDDDDDMEIEFNVSEKTQVALKPMTYIGILLETVVNPSHLVPAQTNTRDSLVPTSNNQTNDYIPNIPSPPLLATHRRLQQELEAMIDTKSDTYLFTKSSLDKVRKLYMSAMTIPSIVDFSPQLVAYQLTLIESSIFKSIPKHALLTHSSRTPHKKIVASTDFFNFITRSIEHSILLPQDASRRAELIHRWIKIATKLSMLHNYQTLKAVVSALGTPPIQRLRRTWDCIPKKHMARLDLLNTLMSESDNYQKYREHLCSHKVWYQPVVPFLGVFIHDVTYLSAAGKQQEVQDILNTLANFQRSPEYPIQPPTSFVVPKKNLTDALHFGSKKTMPVVEHQQQLITQYLLMRPWVTEKTIDSLSLVREPAKPRSVSSPTTSRFSMETIADVSPTLYSSSPVSSGILSNASSFMRFHHEDAEKKSLGFWPFRKSSDMSRSTDSDEEEPTRSILNKKPKRHSRSLSLPSKDFDLAVYQEGA